MKATPEFIKQIKKRIALDGFRACRLIMYFHLLDANEFGKNPNLEECEYLWEEATRLVHKYIPSKTEVVAIQLGHL